MIIKKETYLPEGARKEVTKLSLNVDFWKKAVEKYGSINVVLDEAHQLFNPRRSMSKTAIIMTDFLAMLRRVVGSNSTGAGELIVITQLERRLDIILKEMATAVHYHILSL